MKVNRVLVTGVAGFIAARTAEFLLEQGCAVVGIDNLNDYYDVRLKQHRLEALQRQSGFVFHQVDIEDQAKLEPLFARNEFQVAFNLAARAGVRYSMENPWVYLSTNAMGTLNLLELMRKHAVPKMVLASTSSLYAGQPIPFNEELPVNTPISPYAASKKAAEVMSFSYHHLYRLDISVMRYFTVYGPAGRPDMSIFRFIKWIDEGQPLEVFGDGSQCRDFTYVDDIARGTILAGKELGYEIINLGGGRRPVSLNEIISRLEQLLGRKALIQHRPFHPADLKETGADIRKAARLLSWQPEIDVDVGLRRTVEWYQNNRDWVRRIQLG
jgi:UDP-glucuronate 4-epimerase